LVRRRAVRSSPLLFRFAHSFGASAAIALARAFGALMTHKIKKIKK
jgi:hypothetical protein